MRGWWEFVRRRVTGLYVARCREWRFRLCFTSPRVLHRLSLPRVAFWFCELLRCFLHEPHSSRGSREGRVTVHPVFMHWKGRRAYVTHKTSDNVTRRRKHVTRGKNPCCPALFQPPYGINPPRSFLADTKLMTTREMSPICATIPPKCLPFGLPLEYPWM